MSGAKIVRHFEISDPRRSFAQGWSDIEAAEAAKLRWIHRVNEAYKPWQPLLGLAGVLALFWVAMHAVPVLWRASWALLGAVEFAMGGM